MGKSKFFEQIQGKLIEREVEDIYNVGINMYFPDVPIEHPFGCDGLITTKTPDNKKLLKLIIEYKFEEDFSSKTSRAKVLVQVLYYLKKFEENGLILPNVVMVADRNECFVFHSNPVLKYLDEPLDWSIAPSNAHKYNADLILKIVEDEEFNPFIFQIDENFSFKTVVDKIVDLADNIQRYVHVTEHNIATIFEYFTKRVIKDKKKISANELVAIFMGVITDKENYYQHPSKKNILITPISQINIDGDGFISFFSYFNRNYTPQEKNKFAEISDRLIEDTNRRRKGEFYTPTPFVDYAHKMLCEQFGENWRDEYVVWDNCWGTGNLTRDYRFKELYCSTLEESELEIGKRYNPEAEKFQYDFLNDDLEKLPIGLLKAFEENKPIIFLMNPPYMKGGNWCETTNKGASSTIINKEMLQSGFGAGSDNLQHQFIYRIIKIKEFYKLTNLNIGWFTKPVYLTGDKCKTLLSYICNNFSYKKGVMFQASNFADVSDRWGITFNIWKTGETKDKHNFSHDLIEFDNKNELYVFDTKNLYNVHNLKLASAWIREETKGKKVFDFPSLSSGLKIKETEKNKGCMCANSIGYYLNDSNNIQKNNSFVALFSSSFAHGQGLSILPENFSKVVSLFSARKLIVGDWVNDKDEYLAPDTEHPKYKEFENDSIVYSLFNTSSNQSSLRQIEYKGKKWDIKNEFFWMPKDEIIELANQYHNDDVYHDAHTDSDRYVYTILKNKKVSEEATAVLNKATELVRSSFKYRKLFAEEHPEYHINTWDCGWYQIKGMLKEYDKTGLDEFNKLYKKLSEKMRPLVYELKFLK